jgi:hypothetical protein
VYSHKGDVEPIHVALFFSYSVGTSRRWVLNTGISLHLFS